MAKDMSAKLAECMKPHALMHSLTGFGVALLLVGLFKGLAASALMLGIVAIVAGIVGDMMVNK